MKTRRNLKDLRIERIALTRGPAQDGAEIVIAKRKPDDAVGKMHPHDDEDEKTYVDRFMADRDMKAEHPDDAKRGEAARSKFKTKKTAKAAHPAPDEGEPAMTEIEAAALKDQLAKSAAALETAVRKAERAERVAALTDDEKAVFKSLSGAAAENFLVCSATERDATVAKANEADAVIYKSAAGRVYRRSDDPEKVEFAKRLDATEAELAKARATRDEDLLKARCATTIGNFAGDIVAKSAVLRAVEALPEEGEVRAKAVQMLKSADAALAFFAKAHGSKGNQHQPGGGDTAEAKIESLAKARAEASGGKESFEQAYSAVTKTPEGAELFARMRSEAAA